MRQMLPEGYLCKGWGGITDRICHWQFQPDAWQLRNEGRERNIMGYQIKITIKGSKPPIWRRVIVPDRITFADLDAVIESVFGWTHSHLYEFYFKEDDVRFTIDPSYYNQGDAEKECIDAWMWEGNKCLYIYDFGDDWMHDLVVEKIVPYDCRYATVVKSKGPYMIEDCGGIWGFYRYIDEAEDFDLEYANQELRMMEFDYAAPEDETCEDEDEEFQEYLKSVEGREALLDEMEQMMHAIYESRLIAEDWIERNGKSEEIPSLESVIMQYPKKAMMELAAGNGFTGYTALKKAELAKWVAKRLLDSEYMEKRVETVSRGEINIFENAMEHPEGIWVSEEIMEDSLFLSSYGAFNSVKVLRIPTDVKEAYQRICTAKKREVRDRKWLIEDYCESARYLYGIIPIDKLAEIYQGYEGEELPLEDIMNLIAEVVKTEGILYQKGKMLIDEELLEEDIYQVLLEMQGDNPYYVPSDREEFLAYGMGYDRVYSDNSNEIAEGFVEFLQLKYQLEEPFAQIICHDLESYIHADGDIDNLRMILMEELEQYGKTISKNKRMKDVESQLRKLWEHTRILSCRGYTRAEIRNRKQKPRFSVVGKVYPNDPCPCGSGMKYKHCCGKK